MQRLAEAASPAIAPVYHTAAYDIAPMDDRDVRPAQPRSMTAQSVCVTPLMCFPIM